MMPQLAPLCVEVVHLYLRPDSVKAPYEEVAYLKVEGTGPASPESMTSSLLRKAADLGANGVIYHPYLDRHTEFLAKGGNATAILIPADTTEGAVTCAATRQRWADSLRAGPRRNPGKP